RPKEAPVASQELTGTTALVTGASSGFGRATTVALLAAGANVVAVARNAQRLDELRDELGGSLTTVTADVADPVVAGSLLEQHRPRRRHGNDPLHHRLRRRRILARGTRHPLPLAAAQTDPGHRPRRCGGDRLRSTSRHHRRRVPREARPRPGPGADRQAHRRP